MKADGSRLWPRRSPPWATANHFPVTTTGRFVAVALMLVGIACIGAITAGVAAWLVRQVEAEEDLSRPWA